MRNNFEDRGSDSSRERVQGKRTENPGRREASPWKPSDKPSQKAQSGQSDQSDHKRPRIKRSTQKTDDRPNTSERGYNSRERTDGPEKKFFVPGGSRPEWKADRQKSLGRPVRTEKKGQYLEVSAQKEEIRLNKYIANSGICSRREADEFIRLGLVIVNGNVVTELGSKVKPTDLVKVDGRMIKNERKVYIVMNKPKDTLTTCDDEKGRRTVLDLLGDKCNERVFPVGRLDRNTTGVLLLTNDGELAEKLSHPGFNKKKIYQINLDKKISPDDMRKISEGIELEDGLIQVDEISLVDPSDKSIIGVEIHSGKNRIVRRIFEHLGYKVKALDRVYFAGLTKKGLPRGHWRYLAPNEVSVLFATSNK